MKEIVLISVAAVALALAALVHQSAPTRGQVVKVILLRIAFVAIVALVTLWGLWPSAPAGFHL